MKDNLTISISSGTIVKVVLVLVFSYLLFILRDLVLIVLASIVIASAIEPGIRWFIQKKIPRILAVILIYTGLVFLVLFLILFVVPTFLAETSGLVDNVPKYLSQINSYIPLLDESFFQGYAPFIKDIAERISSYGSGAWTAIQSEQFLSATAIFSGALNIVLMFVLSFYFSVTEDGVGNFLRIITPANKEAYVASLWKRTKDKIGSWMQGQLLLGALVGFLIYAMLSVLGVRHAFLLALIAGIFEIIPVFGPILAAIPAVALSLLDRGAGQAVFVLGWFLIVQQLENNLFYPLVVKKIVGVSPLVVILALIIGAKLAGIIGILLSVPVSVLLMEFVDDLDKKKAERLS